MIVPLTERGNDIGAAQVNHRIGVAGRLRQKFSVRYVHDARHEFLTIKPLTVLVTVGAFAWLGSVKRCGRRIRTRRQVTEGKQPMEEYVCHASMSCRVPWPLARTHFTYYLRRAVSLARCSTLLLGLSASARA
jgi:hypothetical protein